MPRFPGRSRVPGESFTSRNLEAYTTAMNVSQREDADGIMANDGGEVCSAFGMSRTFAEGMKGRSRFRAGRG